MQVNKNLVASNTTMLVLKLLEEKDMYGYQMIEALSERSDNTFSLKAGTLYPILHGLEKQGILNSYDEVADNARVRKYYNLTPKGRQLLREKQAEWKTYSRAVNKVLEKGDIGYAFS